MHKNNEFIANVTTTTKKKMFWEVVGFKKKPFDKNKNNYINY